MKVEDMIAFTPIRINKLEVKNRFVSAPFGGCPSANYQNKLDDKSFEYFRDQIDNGVGLIIGGIVPISNQRAYYQALMRPKKPGEFTLPNLNDESDLEGWKNFTEKVHSYGAKVTTQIGLWGPNMLFTMSDLPEDNLKYSFTSLEGKNDVLPAPFQIPTSEMLEQYVKDIAKAALIGKKGGLDCIEVHSAHSSALLYATALDPFFNDRDDEWGGDANRRLTLATRTINAIREACGPDFPIIFRINGDDLKGELGNTVEDVCEYIVPGLEKAGLDCFDLSQGGPMYTTQGPLMPGYYPRATWLHLSKAIKQVTKKPVIGVGRILTVEMAEKYLRDGSADLINLGRQIRSDPFTIKKFLEGSKQPTRQCIGCLVNHCQQCTINYDGHALKTYGPTLSMAKAEKSKKVVIIGGGIAGMEAARVAAARGHNVTLLEKEAELGGIVGLLSTTPLLSEFRNPIDYIAGELRNMKVDVRVCCEATKEIVESLKPDVIILATGSTMSMPERLAGEPMVMTHLDALKRQREFRSFYQWHKKVVIYGFSAAEFALDLAEAGSDVTLIGLGGDGGIGAEGWMSRERKFYLQRKLTDRNFIRRSEDAYKALNPLVLFRSKVEAVEHKGIRINHNGLSKVIPYDVLIVSGGRKGNIELLKELEGIAPELYKIGDCSAISNINRAIVTANEVARKI